MFTLQIQDRDQPFLHPLAGRPLVIGSDDGVDLRLQAPGVAPRHARIDFQGEVPVLIALGGTTVPVNGRAVRRAPLQLGDRIELGGAVLVVGQSVTRPAVAEDVLQGAVVGRTGARPAPKRKLLVPMVATLTLVIGAIVVLPMLGNRRPAELVELDGLRRVGAFEQAHALVDTLRADWVAADAARAQQLAEAVAQLEALERAVEVRTQQLRAWAAVGTDAQLQIKLDQEVAHAQDAGDIELRAAELVRARCAEIVRDVVRTPRGEPEVAAATPSGASALPATPSSVASAPAPDANASANGDAASKPVSAPRNERDRDSAEPTAARGEVPAVLVDVDRLAGQGLFAQALDALQTGIASLPAADAEQLLARQADLLRTAQRECQTLIAAARFAAKSNAADAVAQLEQASHRFPSSGEFAALGRALDELRGQATVTQRGNRGAVDETVRRATLQELREQLDRVRTAEAAGDFATAAQLLTAGSAMAKERDADFAARMLTRAAEFTLLDEWHRAVAALLQQGQAFDVQLRSGTLGKLHGCDGTALLVTGASGEVRASWPEVAAAGIAQIAAAGKLAGHAVLGGAALLYRAGEASEAEALLARALKQEPALKPEIDQALARGRGEEPDPRGYTLGKDGFVSARTTDAGKEAQQLLTKLDALLRGKDKKGRDAFAAEVLARGPGSLPAITSAFKQQLQKQVEQIDRSALKKQIDKIDAQRQQLDQARTFAKDLIYDEVKYFYPYKPPQVSGERYAEYMKVQAEVDRRVDAVRALWGDDRFKIKVPAKVADDLERLDWLASMLNDLGELDQNTLAEVAWARALPPGDTITIKNYCRTVQERDDFVLWQHIEAYNDKLQKSEKGVSVVEFELLRITNDYRTMFRHRPLALNLTCCKASRSHADEMNTLGYFSHFSPTPGRRTPFDRMKLAGYEYGVSENIALVDSAPGAHGAWLHSSGHHRNLLNPSHTEIGIGQSGRNWVQNFGGGKGWQEHAAWKATESKH